MAAPIVAAQMNLQVNVGGQHWPFVIGPTFSCLLIGEEHMLPGHSLSRTLNSGLWQCSVPVRWIPLPNSQSRTGQHKHPSPTTRLARADSYNCSADTCVLVHRR